MCSRKKILCVGMCVLDVIHICEEYPKEDTDKRCLKGHSQRGGNASNNCTVLRQLGANCEFLGVLSSSNSFRFLIDDCNKRNIEIKNCPKVEQDPPFSSVILSVKSGTRTIIHSNPNFPILKYEDFKKINLNEYEWIHFEVCYIQEIEGRNPDDTVKMMEHIIEYNSKNPENQITISVDFEKVKKELLILGNYANYGFLGKDLALHLGWKDMKTAVYEFKKKLNNNSICIICPWGSIGASVLDFNGEYNFAKANKVDKITDSLGAGDTFCASVIFALSYLKKSPKESIEFGNYVAASKLKFYGYDEIEKIKNLYCSL